MDQQLQGADAGFTDGCNTARCRSTPSKPAELGAPRPAPRPGPQARTARPAAPTTPFRGLLEHLTTSTRNQVRLAGAQAAGPMLAEPASAQGEAFDLIGVPVPLILKQPEQTGQGKNARSNPQMLAGLAVASA
jgi:hypothetical protein